MTFGPFGAATNIQAPSTSASNDNAPRLLGLPPAMPIGVLLYFAFFLKGNASGISHIDPQIVYRTYVNSAGDYTLLLGAKKLFQAFGTFTPFTLPSSMPWVGRPVAYHLGSYSPSYYFDIEQASFTPPDLHYQDSSTGSVYTGEGEHVDLVPYADYVQIYARGYSGTLSLPSTITSMILANAYGVNSLGSVALGQFSTYGFGRPSGGSVCSLASPRANRIAASMVVPVRGMTSRTYTLQGRRSG